MTARTIGTYRHAAGTTYQPRPSAPACDCGPNARYCASAEGIRFYVTVTDGARIGYLAGPYPDHAGALAVLRKVRELAERADARAVWYGIGTARGRADLSSVFGRVKV